MTVRMPGDSNALTRTGDLLVYRSLADGPVAVGDDVLWVDLFGDEEYAARVTRFTGENDEIACLAFDWSQVPE